MALIPMPVLRKDRTLAELEARITRDLTRYYDVAARPRAAFFLNNLIANARRKGIIGGSAKPQK